MKLKRLSENYQSSTIPIGMLERKEFTKSFWKLKEHMKYLLMSVKETLMIFMVRRVWLKFKKDLNQKEAILEQK
jgi:hypothetical protein